MNPRLILVILAALAASLLVLFGVRALLGAKSGVKEQRAEATAVVRVLSAARPLALGAHVKPEDLTWVELPSAAISPAFITDAAQPNAVQDLTGATAKAAIYAGELLVAERFLKAGDRSVLAALISPGFRAIGVPIKQETAAAGFILPNDRVDVILASRTNIDTPNGSQELVRSNVVLEDVRVLAIDQTVTAQTDANGVTSAVPGAVATLELSPGDAEILTMAGQLGPLSLALRGVQDERPLDRSATTSAARRNAPALQQNVSAGDVVLLHADGKATPTTVLER